MPYDVEQEVSTKKQKAIEDKRPKKEKLTQTELIENRVLRELERPEGFHKVEIKDVGKGCFRINIITKTWKEGSFMPCFARPISWYEKVKG